MYRPAFNRRRASGPRPHVAVVPLDGLIRGYRPRARRVYSACTSRRPRACCRSHKKSSRPALALKSGSVDRFVELATLPPSEWRTKSRVAFKAHRIFAGGFFKSRRLEIFFDLPEPVPEDERDARFRAVWEQARMLWTHRLKLESLDDLDDSLARWLQESWATYAKPPGERA